MKNDELKQKIEKLPVWAKEYIRNLERQRGVAINTLNDSLNDQEVSAFYYEPLVCTGEDQGPTLKRVYVQTCSLMCQFDGVELRISAHHSNNEVGIGLQWSSVENRSIDIAFIPKSYQTARLVAKEDMG